MRTFAVLGSARVAVGQPGQAWYCPALTRSNDSMLRNLPQQEALIWDFYPMLGPSSLWLL